MAHMLGRQDSIVSLRRDLVDIQDAVLDVFSRTGPVSQPSWKFPQRFSSDLDILALLEQYDYVEGEETFNQHSHIVLLELVIDRLLLLIQSFNVYVQQLRHKPRQQQLQQKGFLSVGLVVRSYWNNLVQFSKVKGDSKVQKAQINEKSSDDETQKTSPVSSQTSSATNIHRHQLSTWSSTSSLKTGDQNLGISTPNSITSCCPVIDSHSVGCQTFASSLAPCDACHKVQCVLRKTGNALVDLIQSEGLPTSLQPFIGAVEETLEIGQMTAVDVAQWGREQFRDLRRLEKHLQDVRGTVQPLKERVATVETELGKFRFQLEQAREEIEKQQTSNVQFEFSLRKAERALKETELKLKEEQQCRTRETVFLEENSLRLKEEITSLQKDLQVLESERNALQEKAKTSQIKEENISKLQEQVQQLEIQIDESQRLFNKESAKYNSACRQQESMQVKQNSLLERADSLDRECEELQQRLEKQEEKEVTLNKKLQEFSTEKEQLQVDLTKEKAMYLDSQKEKEILEMNICEMRRTVTDLEEYVRVLKERERLLVAFPDLTPLAQTQLQSTGDVLLDMQHQLHANNIRIKVLEQQNASIQRSLEKHGERERHSSPQETPPQKLSASPFSMLSNNQQVSMTSAALQGGIHEGQEVRARESAVDGLRSEDRMSASSSQQIHLKCLHLNTTSALQNLSKQQRSALPSHIRRANTRKKLT